VRLPLRLFCKDGNQKGASSETTTPSSFPITLWILPPLAPPSDIDRTPFASIVSGVQRGLSLKRGRTAWLSTLGGGYFSIRNLARSLWLSRQQRGLAIELGDFEMARRCTLNEAYNWMHAGRFGAAARVLGGLEEEVKSGTGDAGTTRGAVFRVARATGDGNTITDTTTTANTTCDYTKDDARMLKQCRAARLFLRRMKRLSEKGLRNYRVHKDDGDGGGTPSSSSSSVKGVSRTVDDFQRFRIVSC